MKLFLSRFFFKASVVLFAYVGTADIARAAAITVDGGVQTFTFGDFGSSFFPDFTFTLSQQAYLTVSDEYLSGDTFLVTNSGIGLGRTSKSTLGSDVGGDFFAAIANSAFSSAEFTLGPGAYDISGIVLKSPYQSGGAGLDLTSSPLTIAGRTYGVSAVPLPPTLLLFGAGILGLCGFNFLVRCKKDRPAEMKAIPA